MSTTYELRSPINSDSLSDELTINEFLRNFNLQWFKKDKKFRLRYINNKDELSYLWFNFDKQNNIWNFTKYGCCDVTEMILKLEWVFGVKFWDEHSMEYSYLTH